MKKKGRIKPSKLEGKKPDTIEPNITVLILCEDSKSSKRYFEKFRDIERLSSTYVQVYGSKECGSAPINVVNYAKEKVRSVNEGESTIIDKYDKVYCVIDVDEHTTLDAALVKGRANDFDMIVSNPCFEYWYLLHKVNTGVAITNTEKLYSKIGKLFKTKYDKSGCFIFDELYPLTKIAINNSKNINKSQWQYEDDITKCNPSTKVHELIELLQKLSRKKIPY